MTFFDWNNDKNEELRGVAFEDVVYCISHGHLLDTMEHTNKDKYSNQRVFIVNMIDCCWF